MRVKLLSIGDELLIGQTVNTNAAWMGRALTDEGWRVIGVVSLPDTPEDIKRELDMALAQAEVVLVTGGLGPTKDDLTKHVLAEHFGTQLVMHEDIAASIQNWFESRNVPFLEVNRLQAMLPEACTVLPNPLGTASGMWFERPEGKVVVSMPGVPYEMEGLMMQEVLPRLRRHFQVPTTLYETVVTAGIGESSLAALVSDWEDALPSKGVSIAYLPSPGQVKVRLGVQGPAEERTRLAALLNDEVDAFVAQAQRHVIGRGRSGLPEAVLSKLRASSQTVCTAESCTGGKVASMLTAVPGASASMMGAVVAYDNGVKVNQLGVSRGRPRRPRGGQRDRRQGDGKGSQGPDGHRLGHFHVRHRRAKWRHAREASGDGVDGHFRTRRRGGVVSSVWFPARTHCPTCIATHPHPSARCIARRWGQRVG